MREADFWCGGSDLEEYSVVGVQGPRADAPESACSLYYYEQTPDHFPALKIKNILEFSDLVLIHFVPNFQKNMRQFRLGGENVVIRSHCIFFIDLP